MATGPPTGGPAPLQVLEQSPPPTPTSWDGDRMFNIYIHDYCIKRGYVKTASELVEEAEIPAESTPPINAKQGLLFEWWSVFWVLFTAKSSGTGTDDALVYTQHQTQQANQRPGARPPQQPANARYMTTVNGTRPGAPQAPLPNGIPPTNSQPGQSIMPNGTQGGAFGAPVPPPNGMAGPSHPAVGTPAMMTGQRPGAVPQRGPNGAQFQSPIMTHSPQHSGPPPQQMGGNMGPQGSMHQMRGTMPPPGPPQGIMGNPQQSVPPFHPLPGSSNSHPNSPAAHAVSQSPSMANRQPQMQPGPNRNGGPEIRQLQESNVNSDLFKIDSQRLPVLKEEIGLTGVDLPSMSMEDKSRLVNLARERGALLPQAKPGPPQNAAAGPSSRMQQPMHQSRPLGPPFAQQGHQQQRTKRNSTSPGEENDQGQNDSSPPVNKRPRTSPAGQDQQQPPMAGLVYPPQQPMHGGPGGPQHPQGGMMPMMAGANGSFASGPRMVNPPMPGPHMANTMMANPMTQYRQNMTAIHKNSLPPGALNMMPPSAPSPASTDSPFPTSTDGLQSRPGTGQFPGNRPPQQQNKPMAMMPPPSPSAKPKEGDGNGNGNPPSVHSSPHNLPAVAGGHGSQPPSQQSQGGGTGPPTPAQNAANIAAPSPSANMSHNQTPGSQQGPSNNQPPHPPASAPPSTNASNDLFMSTDLMQTLGMNAFDTFDSSLFQSDHMGTGGDLDFASMVNFEGSDLWGGFS
ncbi:hypothetical protein BC835DRAFT_1421096 [Cytidiella melzeri]|nr:hypothetical protein BC835DRAFT_1421096 [Cytidiella melzeri]